MRNIDLNKVILITHHPIDLSHSVTKSIHSLFVADDAPYMMMGFFETKDTVLDEGLESQILSYQTQGGTFIFNGLTSVFTQFGNTFFTLAIKHDLKVIIYSHETAWNMRYLLRKHAPLSQVVSQKIEIVQPFFWATSLQCRQLSSFNFGVPYEKIAVVRECMKVPDGLPCERRNAVRKYIGSGIIDQRKGFDLFHRFAEEGEWASECEFTWHSARDSLYDPGLPFTNGRVKWKKPTDDFISELESHDAFLMVSRDDPFPIVVLEALSVDRPVFTIEGSGWAEVLPDEFVATSVSELIKKAKEFEKNIESYPPGFFNNIAKKFDVANFESKNPAFSDYKPNEIAQRFPICYDLNDRGEKSILDNFAKIDNELYQAKLKLRNKHLEVVEFMRELGYLQKNPSGLKGLLSRKIKEADKFNRESHRQARMEMKKHLRKTIPRKFKKTNSVAIIGNSPNLIGSGLGAMIDDCDLVIRVNDFATYGHECDVGSKTDLAFVSFAVRPNSELDRMGKDCIYLYAANKFNDKNFLEERLLNGTQKEKPSGLDLGKVKILSPTLYFYGLKILAGLPPSCWPSTGLAAIQWALDMFSNTATIYTAGFSFYSESGKTLQRYYGRTTERDSAHDFVKEKQYFDSLVRNDLVSVLNKEA